MGVVIKLTVTVNDNATTRVDAVIKNRKKSIVLTDDDHRSVKLATLLITNICKHAEVDGS